MKEAKRIGVGSPSLESMQVGISRDLWRFVGFE